MLKNVTFLCRKCHHIMEFYLGDSCCSYLSLPIDKNKMNMGLLDNYSGIGMCPRPKWQHQGVIAHFFKCALPEIYMQDLILLSEATVTDDWDDLAPDLVVFSLDMEPLCIIEITTHAQCNAIIHKCYELIERFPEAEYFVYDYERQILYQYDGENDEWLSSSEYIPVSKYLNKAMMEYL